MIADRTPVTAVALGSLRVAGSPRSAGENLEHIRNLADAQADLPPITVHRKTMRVIDGVHRLYAARLSGRSTIPVRFFDGDEDDAYVFAVRANVTHGLPLSILDRKAAAARIFTVRPQWSDRMIASVAGLAPGTVAQLRRESGVEPGERVGQDGRVRPTNRLERRRHARALMLAEPDLSLRQVARLAGISPETARAVRSRLGEPAAPRVVPSARPAPVVDLRQDPALRFSENGRTLLRLLDMRTISAQRWAALAANVPAHCRESVAAVALECAQAWHDFAAALGREVSSCEPLSPGGI